MRIAFVSAELSPYAQVGGLADVATWLPRSLTERGHDVRVFVPHYDVLDPGGRPVEPLLEGLDLGPLGPVSVSVLGGSLPGYLIGAEHWFGRGVIYGTDPDEHLRFAALARGVVAGCAALDWIPDVVHANDWHTALLPRHAAAAGWTGVGTVFTIHNLAFQGQFDGADLPLMGLPPAAGQVNSLRAGIIESDVVTTVSPTYAREIVTPAHGRGLDAALGARGDRLVGILNGIGGDWDPATDRFIPHPYDTPAGKAPNRSALRARMGLRDAGRVPILGAVGRFDHQKGYDLVEPEIRGLLAAGRVQVAGLGQGDPSVENLFASLAADHLGEVAIEFGFDRALGHLIEAGSDIFLMPSRFEPCGLNQMYSMQYGTVPVVHRTGGLADTVVPWPEPDATGFAFDEATPEAAGAALRQAVEVSGDDDRWARLMRTGMARDFSWAARATAYEVVYDRAAALARGR